MAHKEIIILNLLTNEYITDVDNEYIRFQTESEAEEYIETETDLLAEEYELEDYTHKETRWEREERRGEEMFERKRDDACANDDDFYPDNY